MARGWAETCSRVQHWLISMFCVACLGNYTCTNLNVPINDVECHEKQNCKLAEGLSRLRWPKLLPKIPGLSRLRWPKLLPKIPLLLHGKHVRFMNLDIDTFRQLSTSAHLWSARPGYCMADVGMATQRSTYAKNIYSDGSTLALARYCWLWLSNH